MAVLWVLSVLGAWVLLSALGVVLWVAACEWVRR